MRLLVILCLLLAVLYAGAQTDSCDRLRHKIEGFARRDGENGAGLQTTVVIQVFGKNSCFAVDSTVSIYVNEYYRANKRRRSDWEGLWPRAGWVLASILAFLAIFKDALKKKLVEVFGAVFRYLQRRLGGTRFSNWMALKHYRAALVQQYKMVHIPFRPTKPLDMEQVFIPLRSQGQGEAIELKGLSGEYCKLVVSGPPGSGKSMLCKHLAYQYGTGKTDVVTILVELHRLNDPGLSVLSVIQDVLERNAFTHVGIFLERSLKQGRLFILFDGFDEVNASERGRVALMIKDFIQRYRCGRFIITCRSTVYRHEFAEVTERILELAPFNSHEIRRYLQAWEREMPTGKSINALCSILRDRPQLMNLATNPLMLTIISYLYTDTPYTLPHSRGEFYQIATEVLLNQWHGEINRYRGIDKALLLQRLALMSQDNRQLGSDRRIMDYEKVIAGIREVLSSLDHVSLNGQEILDEIVERSGLLIKVDGGAYLQFAHLTMQEYFAAKALVADVDGLLRRYCGDPDSWRESVKLWCGITNDASYLISRIFEIDEVLALDCLAEANAVSAELVEKIVGCSFQKLDNRRADQETIAKAFGAVASDVRERGKTIFRLLVEKLRRKQPDHHRIAVIRALSYTYLPAAAAAMAPYFEGYPVVREAYLLMDEIAIPSIVNLVNAGFIDALSGLRNMRTPKAALALVRFIWENGPVAATAALFLAEMLQDRVIEDVLRSWIPMPEDRVKGRVEWAWGAFKEPDGSALPMIAGRIVYVIYGNGSWLALLLKMEEPPLFRTMRLDPRIVIPVLIQWRIARKMPGTLLYRTNDVLADGTVQRYWIDRMGQYYDDRDALGYLLNSLLPFIQLSDEKGILHFGEVSPAHWTGLRAASGLPRVKREMVAFFVVCYLVVVIGMICMARVGIHFSIWKVMVLGLLVPLVSGSCYTMLVTPLSSPFLMRWRHVQAEPLVWLGQALGVAYSWLVLVCVFIVKFAVVRWLAVACVLLAFTMLGLWMWRLMLMARAENPLRKILKGWVEE